MAFRDLRALPGDTDDKLLQKIADTLAIALGQRGHDVYGAPGVHTGEWAILHVLGSTAATVTMIRDNTPETITIPAGDRVYGQITSVNATSGLVELYRDN